MSRSALWSLLFTVLLAVGLIWVPEAEAWSVPVFTQPWTEIGINESESVEKDQPAENELQEPEEPAQETSGEASAEIDDFLLDFESLYGTWHIWTPNSFVNLYDQEDGHYVTHDLVAGAEQGMVVVNPDGTYSMTYGAWGEEVVKGKWRLSYPGDQRRSATGNCAARRYDRHRLGHSAIGQRQDSFAVGHGMGRWFCYLDLRCGITPQVSSTGLTTGGTAYFGASTDINPMV